MVAWIRQATDADDAAVTRPLVVRAPGHSDGVGNALRRAFGKAEAPATEWDRLLSRLG